MKSVFGFLFFLLAAQFSFAQPAEVIHENGNKILKGFITRNDLANDSVYGTWFSQNAQGFSPDAAAIYGLRSQKDSIHILAFGGTWCDDTRSIFPKFFSLTGAAGFPEKHITILGVDRSKQTVHNLERAFNVTRVPTFIVLKNGKEIGRVVEYGTTGYFDRDLGQILLKKK